MTALQILGSAILGLVVVAVVLLMVVDALAPEDDDTEPVEHHHCTIVAPGPIDARARGWVE